MDYYRRNELPETVKRYKTYTDQFQAWLVKTAIQRGVEIANIVTDQAEKKKGKKRYKIPVHKQEQLVNAIAATSAPLADTSGINDLDDAIRSRKEVTLYHKHNHTADWGHEYFNGSLESFMAALRGFVPGLSKTRDRKDDKHTLVFIQLPTGPETSQDEQDDLLDKMRKRNGSDLEEDSQQQQTQTPKTKKKVPILETNPLTAEEEQLRREFLILCFLYNLNRIRDAVFEVWTLYRKGLVNVITAALVSDLAQDHVHQNVKALVEELELLPGELTILTQRLFNKINDTPEPGVENPAPIPTEQVLCHMFGLDAADMIRIYMRNTNLAQDSARDKRSEHAFLGFLRFFNVIREGRLKLPKWDHFTGEILLHPKTSQDYLPFGLAIVLDIQEAVREDYRRILRDLTEHGLDIARCIRCHTDYEDRMWTQGTKPDYMCKGEIKFSTILLKPLEKLLDWLQELLNCQEKPMTAGVFITVHATLAGLSMWHFNQIYHHTAVVKIQWFINGLAHLYNAACQLGGLDIQWPDLDHLIKVHGSNVMFRGEPPTHPNDFLNRYMLSGYTSSRAMASDYRHTGKFLPQVSNVFGPKRGLQTELPLDAKIREYYGPNPKKDRWLKRHAVFNYLYQQNEATAETPDDDSEKYEQDLKDLQDTFADLATRITPPKPRRKGKNKSRVLKPDFNNQDETHANLFGTMRSELQDNEVHSNFDLLSFYRRAYDLVLRIREEVLMSEEVQHFRAAEDMNANPEPQNFQLITDLFHALQVEPKTKKEQEAEAEGGAGQQLSTKVVPMKQICRVAELMKELTRDKGDVELTRAKLRAKGDWEGLKTSYAAEDADTKTYTFVDDAVAGVEEETVPGVDGDEVKVVAPVRIAASDYEIKHRHEADGYSEEGPMDMSGSIADTQNAKVPSRLKTTKGVVDHRYQAHEDPENDPAEAPSQHDQAGDSAEYLLSQSTHASMAHKIEQDEKPEEQLRQIIHTAAPASLTAPIHDSEPILRTPSTVKNASRPKRMYHRIPYSITTSRNPHIAPSRPSSKKLRNELLALSHRRKVFFRRLASSVASKHHIVFRCYTRCAMARELHGQQTCLQRQMAIAVAELKRKARRDSAELKNVWLEVGRTRGDVCRAWETESDVTLDWG